jgi:alkylhydroperoxidase/carboxymuconolactone decarboxylase family protein YurZ
MSQPSNATQERGPFTEAWERLREWDPNWAQSALRLIGVALNAACTYLNAEGTRHAIGRALDAGATREEIVTILKCASVMSLHSAALGAPILFEEAKAAGSRSPTRRSPRRRRATG